MTHFDPHEPGPPGFLPPEGQAVPHNGDDPVADLIAKAAELRELYRVLVILLAAIALIFVVGP